MLSLSPLSRSFIDTLNRKKVEYLLVGGHAVQYYGIPRLTRDLDIWVGADLTNAEKLVEVFLEFGADPSEITTSHFQHPNRIIRIDIQPLRIEISEPVIGQKPVSLQILQGSRPEPIEILTVQTGASFEAAYSDRVMEYLDGLLVNIVNLKDLRAIKGSTDRSRDIQDLEILD